MIESWKKKELIRYDTCQTIADEIAVREPIAQALTDMEGLADEDSLVREDSILTATKLLHRHAGLVVEPSGAVGIAAVLEDPEKFRGRTVATIIYMWGQPDRSANQAMARVKQLITSAFCPCETKAKKKYRQGFPLNRLSSKTNEGE